MSYFFEQLVNALSLGGIYALLALGLAVIFSILNMINFAHGALMTLTGYILVFLAQAAVPPIVALPVAIALTAVAAVLMERIAFRPVRGASGATLLITSFAVAVLMQLSFQIFISTRPQVVPLPSALSGTFSIGGTAIGINRLLAIIVTLTVLGGLVVFLKRTTIGLAMRAAAQDFDMVRLMGVKANAVVSMAFAISGAMAAIAGILWISQRASVDPLMGQIPVLKAFIATVLGGLGSLSGAVIGGLVLAAIEIGLSAYLPEAWLKFHGALTLAIVVAILVARPNGIATQKSNINRA